MRQRLHHAVMIAIGAASRQSVFADERRSRHHVILGDRLLCHPRHAGDWSLKHIHDRRPQDSHQRDRAKQGQKDISALSHPARIKKVRANPFSFRTGALQPYAQGNHGKDGAAWKKMVR